MAAPYRETIPFAFDSLLACLVGKAYEDAFNWCLCLLQKLPHGVDVRPTRPFEEWTKTLRPDEWRATAEAARDFYRHGKFTAAFQNVLELTACLHRRVLAAKAAVRNEIANLAAVAGDRVQWEE